MVLRRGSSLIVVVVDVVVCGDATFVRIFRPKSRGIRSWRLCRSASCKRLRTCPLCVPPEAEKQWENETDMNVRRHHARKPKRWAWEQQHTAEACRTGNKGERQNICYLVYNSQKPASAEPCRGRSSSCDFRRAWREFSYRRSRPGTPSRREWQSEPKSECDCGEKYIES